MSSPRFLITGATGFLGRRVVARASGVGVVVAGSRTPSAKEGTVFLDVSDAEATIDTIVRVAPKAIIHLAAINPGQGDDDEMWRVNAEGSAAVALGAVRSGARLVSVSTDVVHDGTAAPYADDVAPSPLNAYGSSKAAGEVSVLEVDPSAVVVRTSLMYGLDTIDRGTAGFADRIHRNEPVQLFTDVIRNPIWVETLAEALVRLVDSDFSGLVNIAGTESLSRYDYGVAMLDHWGIAHEGRLEAVLAADVSDTIPRDLRLDSSRARTLLDMDLPGVHDVLTARA
ncbi:SDR family oxidoreductase [Actinomycetota bacterium]